MIALFNFYVRYLWKYLDFADFQSWIYNTIEGGRIPSLGAATGLKVSVPGTLHVAVSAGRGFGSTGRLLILASAADVVVASPAGNPARTLIVLRPVDTNADNIPEPTNPSNTVPLHVVRTAQVVVINGTPAANPSYPAIQSGDLILAGFLVTTGASVLTMAMVETYKRDVPVPFEKRIRRVTATYTVTIDDDILEVNTATINLPVDPTQFSGKRWTFINWRTTAATVTVDGNGTNVSGQATQVIDDQWGKLDVYCNGVNYVVG